MGRGDDEGIRFGFSTAFTNCLPKQKSRTVVKEKKPQKMENRKTIKP